MKVSNREAIEEQIAADYVVTSLDGYTPFVAAAGDALAASPVPEVVTSVRSDAGLVNGDTAEIGGIDPDTIAEAYVFDWQDGDDSVLATLGTTNAVVEQNFAEDHDIAVGDTLTLRSTADRTAQVTVVGTFEPPPFYPLLESVNVSTELFDSLYDRPRNRWTWANVAGEPSDENRAQMEAAIAGFPDTQLETREEWIEREDSDINEFISFLYVMLTLAVFVSIFGMINTLVLVGLRAHARDRDAARDRDDAPAGAPDGPPGEHHHGAHRRRDRAAARDLPRGARQPRARGVRHSLRRSRGCSSSC